MVSCFPDVLKDPPSIGSVITVKHSGVHPSGILKSPFFWRERKDIEWKAGQEVSQVSLVGVQYFMFFFWSNHQCKGLDQTRESSSLL